MYLLSGFAILIFGFVLYAIARRYLLQWQLYEITRRNHCEPIPRFRGAGVLGAEFSREVRASFQNGTVNQTALQHYQRVGSLTYEVPTVAGVELYTADPANHKAIATRLDDWVREVGTSSYAFFGTNAAITHQNGSAWRRSRDLIMPLFRRAELRNTERFGAHVDVLMAKLPGDGNVFDMQPWLRKLFLDVSTEFVFGESINSLENPLSDSDEFIAAFNRAAAGAGKRLLSNGLRKRLYALGSRDRAWLADCKVVHDYVDGCIARHRRRRQSRPGPAKHYILLEGMSEETHDPVQLRFRLLGIFSLARETSAMAMSNVLFLLARHPRYWVELHELSTRLSPRPDEELDFDQIRGLPPLFRHVILETFRLHSPVTRIRRVAARDTMLPRGGGPGGRAPALVRKGTPVWCDRFPKFRDPDIWGEDVDDFRPERFEGKQLGWEFLPFSGGPRMCPANQLVVTQCIYLLVRLTYQFRTIVNGDACMEFVEKVMLCFESKNGCQIAFQN